MALKWLPLSSTIISWLAKERMSAFPLKWLPVRYFAWLLNKNAFVAMPLYHVVMLTDLQNGDPVCLTRPLSGGLEVALCELTYYHQFYNISAALKIIRSEMDPRWYLMGITTFASWTSFSSFWMPSLLCIHQRVAYSCLRWNVWIYLWC